MVWLGLRAWAALTVCLPPGGDAVFVRFARPDPKVKSGDYVRQELLSGSFDRPNFRILGRE
jgi:hypothetical protein